MSWCIARLGEDYQWWVDEISDEVHWDVDGLSIIDPKQIAHIVELLDPLRDYDFLTEMFEDAFFTFTIDKKMDNQRLRLRRLADSMLDSDELYFALPDIVDEDKSPYADFLDHITRLRVKMLNDLIDFEQKFTVEELEEEIREEHNNQYLEGTAVHAFKEVTDILEFVPEGFELDEDDKEGKDDEADIEEEFPDIEEDEEEISKDETMTWEDEDEEAEAELESSDDIDDLEDDD